MERQNSLLKKILPLFCLLRGNRCDKCYHNVFTLFSIIVLAIFTGCSSQKRMQSYQIETDNLRRELKFVKEQNLRLRRELDGVKKRLTEQEQVTSQNRADLATRLEELSLQLEAIQNETQDTNHRITAMSEKVGYAPVYAPVVG